MKVTEINMKQVSNGKPFQSAQWRKPTLEEQEKIYGALSKINRSRVTA